MSPAVGSEGAGCARRPGPDLEQHLAIVTEELHELARERARPVHAGHLVLPAELAARSHPGVERPRPSHDQGRQRQADALGAMSVIVGVAPGQVAIEQPAKAVRVGGGSRNSITYW